MKFDGPLDYLDLRDKRSLFNIDFEEILFHQSLGMHFVLLSFPAILLALPVLLARSKFRMSPERAYLLALPVIMVILFYAKCPHHSYSYMYHVIAMGTLIGVYTLKQFGLSEKAMRNLLFILIVGAVADLAGHMLLACSLALSGLIFGGLALAGSKKLRPSRAFGITVIFALLIGLIPLESYYENTKYEKYTRVYHWEKDLTAAWGWIYKKTSDEPKNIAYAGSSVTLPLYGKDFKNNVYCVSVNEKEPYLTNFTKYYHLNDGFKKWLAGLKKDGCLRERADFGVWLKNIRKHDTDYLFIMSTDDRKYFPLEAKWARRHPEIFTRVLINTRVRIYEVEKSDGAK